jgi:hypothetical protein
MNTPVYERTISIPIPLKKTSSFENKELSLTHTCIDPSKMSPPNSFMDKLVKRMDNYYSPTNASASMNGKQRAFTASVPFSNVR